MTTESITRFYCDACGHRFTSGKANKRCVHCGSQWVSQCLGLRTHVVLMLSTFALLLAFGIWSRLLSAP